MDTKETVRREWDREGSPYVATVTDGDTVSEREVTPEEAAAIRAKSPGFTIRKGLTGAWATLDAFRQQS